MARSNETPVKSAYSGRLFLCPPNGRTPIARGTEQGLRFAAVAPRVVD